MFFHFWILTSCHEKHLCIKLYWCIPDAMPQLNKITTIYRIILIQIKRDHSNSVISVHITVRVVLFWDDLSPLPLASLWLRSCMSFCLAYSVRSLGITQHDSRFTWLIPGLIWEIKIITFKVNYSPTLCM